MSHRIKDKNDYTKILPVLFLEFLSVSLARTLFPEMIVAQFGDYSYLVVGIVETMKGLLAFVSSPLFGKLSDKIGRKYCLLVTVLGTTLPVYIMIFTTNMYIYGVAMSISGFFSATFALTFAYISDCVDKKIRAPAYGLALATYGLSFTIGPITGSYIADLFGNRIVFVLSGLLVIINIIYIIFKLPETVKSVNIHHQQPLQKFGVALEYLPNSWNFKETFQIFSVDRFMSNLSIIVFIYYTSVWAIGWLFSAYGVATMLSESILVRIIVPIIGEVNSMRLGLLSFSIQCLVISVSTSPSWIFISVLFSMGANLFYPSVSSLVSKVVSEDTQGEALGGLNGIKAVTEGFGPLLFGLLMAIFERSSQPGAPYLIASMLSLWAFLHCFELPNEYELDAYIVKSMKKDLFRKEQEETCGLLSTDHVDSDNRDDIKNNNA